MDDRSARTERHVKCLDGKSELLFSEEELYMCFGALELSWQARNCGERHLSVVNYFGILRPNWETVVRYLIISIYSELP